MKCILTKEGGGISNCFDNYIITPLRETLYKYMGFKEAPAFMTIEMMWLNFFELSFFGFF